MKLFRLTLLVSLILLFAGRSFAEVVYVLVDNSNSMANDQQQSNINETLDKIVESLPDESAISITTFGGAGSSCSTPINVQPLVPLVANPDLFTRPQAGGYTQTTLAIQAAYAQIDEKNAKLLVLTDGVYSCGNSADLCSSIRRLETEQPNIDLRKWLVSHSGESANALSCMLAHDASSMEVNYRFAYRQVVLRLLYALPFLLLIASAILWLFRTADRSRKILEEVESEPKAGSVPDTTGEASAQNNTALKTEKPRSKWKSSLWTLIKCVLVLFLFAVSWGMVELFAPGAELAREWWLELLNSPFGSLLASSLAAGFVGWVLLERWKAWQALNAKAVREMEARKEDAWRAERRDRILAKFHDLIDESNQEDERTLTDLYSRIPELDGATSDESFRAIKGCRDWMYALLKTKEAAPVIENYEYGTLIESRVARTMTKDKLIGPDRKTLIREIFQLWKTALRAKTFAEFNEMHSAILLNAENQFSY